MKSMQRGFQAVLGIITTTDERMQETVHLKRQDYAGELPESRGRCPAFFRGNWFALNFAAERE
jgi:hypothetical protein